MTDVYTAVMTIEEAIIASLNADVPFVTVIGAEGKVYSGSIPEGAVQPYVQLGLTNENDAAVVKRSNAGFYNGKVITIFSGAPGKDTCTVIFGHCRRLLHHKKLPLGEGRMIKGALRLVAMYPDPDTGFEIGSLFYDVHTRNAP